MMTTELYSVKQTVQIIEKFSRYLLLILSSPQKRNPARVVSQLSRRPPLILTSWPPRCLSSLPHCNSVSLYDQQNMAEGTVHHLQLGSKRGSGFRVNLSLSLIIRSGGGCPPIVRTLCEDAPVWGLRPPAHSHVNEPPWGSSSSLSVPGLKLQEKPQSTS